jgi:MFS family permease
VFDGYETYALIISVGAAMRQLLGPAELPRAPVYAGAVIALTLLGWGLGGVVAGILADSFGRKRTMMWAIVAYSATTGLSALAWSWQSFALLRFVVGVTIGSEWVTGVSMVAELWPDRARGRGVGLMQCGLGIGFFVASLVWLWNPARGPGAWRFMFVVGVLPALLTLWVRRAVPESALWQDAVRRHRAGTAAPARLTLVELFAEREVRRRAAIAFVMSLATTLGFWGVSTWVPPYVAAMAASAGLSGPAWAGYAGIVYNAGAVAGYVALGFLADLWGRKASTMLYFAGALLFVPVVFVWAGGGGEGGRLGVTLAATAALGCFAAGQYTWMSAWLPELFPTRLRATGAGFVFNAPRLIAWVGPLVSGKLIAAFGGFSQAAMAVGAIYICGLAAAPFLPETRGRPLPE